MLYAVGKLEAAQAITYYKQSELAVELRDKGDGHRE